MRAASIRIVGFSISLSILFAFAQAQPPVPTADEVAKKLGIPIERVRALQVERAMTTSALLELPKERLPRFLRQTTQPDSPADRAAFAALVYQDEKKIIPANARVRALQQLDDLQRRLAPNSRIADVFTGPRVTASDLLPALEVVPRKERGWVALGPDAGGRTRALVIHPRKPNTMFAGSAGGGVWKTEDGGKSWRPADIQLSNLAVSCMVLDPRQPETLYAGTGEGLTSGIMEPRGGGIYRSTDGGATWQQLPDTARFHFINRLAISPDGKVLLAAVINREQRQESGIYHCADPERKSWTRCALNADIGDLKFHPSESSHAIASAAGFTASADKVYYSTDGGAHWKEATIPERGSLKGSGRIELAFAAKDPAIVYASVDWGSKDPQSPEFGFGRLWRSTDGGRSFEKRRALTAYQRPPSFLGGVGWYANVLWAGDPTDADLVVVGGVDLWRSADGGQTLTQISSWFQAPESAHGDQHVVVAHPQFDGKGNKQVFFGNDGGIYTAADIRSVGNDRERINGWQVLNRNYGPIQFYGVAGNARTGTILGGAQDNGTFRLVKDGQHMTWSRVYGGDGGYCAADPDDPRYFYGETQYLGLFRDSGDKRPENITGVHYEAGEGYWKPAPYRLLDSYDQNKCPFIAPFILDPNDSNRLLAGGASLWRTNDVKAPLTPTTGPKWAAIKPPLARQGGLLSGMVRTGNPSISAIAVARGNSDQIWVGHASGEVFRTANGKAEQPHWIQLDNSSTAVLPARFCSRIVIDPTDHKRVYVTFGGYRKENLWRTIDDGKTWQAIGAASLPESPLHTLAIHPRNVRFLYLGTDVGLFLSEDAGTTWAPVNEGPIRCPVRDLFWMGESLVAATYGRGLFRIDLSRPTE